MDAVTRPFEPGSLRRLLLAFPIALFSAALASDLAYLSTEEVQWSHFSAWLIVGGLVFGGLAILGSIVALIMGGRGRELLFLALIAAMWIAGFVNAFQHSKDGWSSVGALGLTLSVVSTVLALIAGWIHYGRRDAR